LPLPDWEAEAPPSLDAYSLRLVAVRKLYDQGTLVRNSPSLAQLAEGTVVRLNPYDFDKLGVPAGEDMRVTSAAGYVIVPVRPDERVPRSTAVVRLNQGGRVNGLFEVGAPATDVRIERPRGCWRATRLWSAT
jgi:NADH-quinone oxidoreductase subunit G